MGREAALVDIAQGLILRELHVIGLLDELVFKGGTSLRKLYAGNAGRFSLDLDFSVREVGADTETVLDLLTEHVAGREIGPFVYDVIERRGKRHLVVSSPGRAGPSVGVLSSKLDVSSPPWLPPIARGWVPMDIHGQYGDPPLPELPVVRMEENLAEKIARLNRATPARDMYDLHWVGRTLLRTGLDIPVVRRLSVLKIWVDAYGPGGRGGSGAITGRAVVVPILPGGRGCHDRDSGESCLGGAMFPELSASVRTVLETYANVHRGSGYTSMVSTYLYERARGVVLEHLGLDRRRYTVVFCSPRQADQLRAQVPPGACRTVSSRDVGLPLGLRAIAVRRRALPRSVPWQPGGGTARLVGPGWVVWAAAPDRFEAGTPAVVNVIAFARALQLAKDAAAQGGEAAFLPARDAASPPGQDAAGERVAAQRVARDILRHDRLDGCCGSPLLAELRKTLIGQRIPVPTRSGSRPFVNLDNAASTPTFEPVWEAVQEAWRQPEPVRREIVEETKLICAEALHAPPQDYEVLFTANTTEAINLAAQSLAAQAGAGVEPVVVNTVMEHNSNELPWRRLPGVGLIHLPVDGDGFVDPAGLEAVLQEYNEQHRHGGQRIALVAVSGASNVLGSCNDLAQIARTAHRHGARLLVDGAQLVAHRAVEVSACGIDYFAFSAHKAYAPFGAGALVARTGTLGFGAAERESMRASGEENVGGIAALGKALVLLQRVGLDVIQHQEQALTARALRGLADIPGLTLFGVQSPDSPRFPRRSGVIAFTLRGVMAGRVAAELARQGGIGVRSGCHCAHILVKRLLGVSRRLERFQHLMVSAFPRLELPGVTRVSLGIENTPQDVDVLLDVLDRIAQQPRAGSPFRRPRPSIRKQLQASTRAVATRVYA